MGEKHVQEEFLGRESLMKGVLVKSMSLWVKSILVKSMCEKSFWVKSFWVKSMCKKGFWVKSLWVKRKCNMGEKSLCETYIKGFLGEESAG